MTPRSANRFTQDRAYTDLLQTACWSAVEREALDELGHPRRGRLVGLRYRHPRGHRAEAADPERLLDQPNALPQPGDRRDVGLPRGDLAVARGAVTSCRQSRGQPGEHLR